MRTCKTSIVIRPQKSEFCAGIAGRFWDKSDADEKRRGLTIPISNKRPAKTIQKHEKPSILVLLLREECVFLRCFCAQNGCAERENASSAGIKLSSFSPQQDRKKLPGPGPPAAPWAVKSDSPIPGPQMRGILRQAQDRHGGTLIESLIPGPQRRGILRQAQDRHGGTLISIGRSYGDRGHPPDGDTTVTGCGRSSWKSCLTIMGIRVFLNLFQKYAHLLVPGRDSFT